MSAASPTTWSAGDFYEATLGLRLTKKKTNRDDPQQLHDFWGSYDGREVAPHSSFTLFGWPSDWNRARPGIGQTHQSPFGRGTGKSCNTGRTTCGRLASLYLQRPIGPP